MASKKAARGKTASKKRTAKTEQTKKGAAVKPKLGVDADSDKEGDTLDELTSPTSSVGPTWDTPLKRLADTVRAAIDDGPFPGLNDTPIHFNNPGNYCYRNAMMTMLMYIPQLLGYVQRWHMLREFPNHLYVDHILQALDDVAQAYHIPGSTRVRDTEEAIHDLWQLFRGEPSSVAPFEGAVPEPEDAEQEDSSELLELMLRQIELQLQGAEDGAQNNFRAMLKTSFTSRTRCPGTRDHICPNPNQKERRALNDDFIFSLTIPTDGNLTLHDCIASEMGAVAQRWCDDCSALNRHTNPDTQSRTDREWRRIRDCPEVLIMKLARFKQVGTGRYTKWQKDKRQVTIPATLDVSEFLEYHSYGEGSLVEYELRGVVSHSGSLNSGHYVAHVKVGKKWWRVDDQGGRHSVTPSSLDKINMDGGGRSGVSEKGKSHPFLLSWVKVTEDVVAPTIGATNTTANVTSKNGRALGKRPKDENDQSNESDEDKHTGKSLGEGSNKKGPKSPVASPSSSSSKPSDEDENVAAANADTANIKVTITVGDAEETFIIRRTTKKGVSCSKTNLPPIWGSVRIVDDKARATQISFANKKGKILQAAAKAASTTIPEKGSASPKALRAENAKRGVRTKRKSPEETYVDPEDDTYIDDGQQKNSKRSKTGTKKVVIESSRALPKPVRKGGRLVRGSKSKKSTSNHD